MFYFGQVELCSFWLMTNHSPHSHCVRVTTAPYNKCIKKLAGFNLMQAGQVKHECNCFQMQHRSVVWGVCVCSSVTMNAPKSTHFLYKSAPPPFIPLCPGLYHNNHSICAKFLSYYFVGSCLLEKKLNSNRLTDYKICYLNIFMYLNWSRDD